MAGDDIVTLLRGSIKNLLVERTASYDLMQEMLDAMQRLQAERDEARRLVCEMQADREQGTPEGWAHEFGWGDLFKEGDHCDARR